MEIRRHTPAFQRFWLPLARVGAAIILGIFGPFRAKDRGRIPREGGLLVLANHISDVDPVAIQYGCPRPVHFMAKAELFDMKGVGWFLRKFRSFPVKRGEPDRQSLKYAIALLKAGDVVVIFPEGELSQNGKLQALKPGIALIARMAGVPVICCGVLNTNRIIPYGTLIPRPALKLVEVRWGEAKTFDKEAETHDILAWTESQLRSLTA